MPLRNLKILYGCDIVATTTSAHNCSVIVNHSRICIAALQWLQCSRCKLCNGRIRLQRTIAC